MKPLDVVNAKSVDEAVEVLGTKGNNVKALAGGTDIVGGLKRRIYPSPPETMVNLRSIPGLSYIREEAEHVRIGALTTLEDLASSDIINGNFSAIADAAVQTASPLLRNAGTIAGNICQEVRCWYFRADDNYFNCLLKGGDTCYAMDGDNRYHSIMGSVQVNPSACSKGCPTGVDVASYMVKIQEGDLDSAAKILLETNAMPAITGRACPHSCQPVCVRKDHDEEVGIRSVERMLGDRVLDNPAQFMTVDGKDSGKHMAVVGSGPTGLAAAYYLRKAGHQVTVYEQFDKPGGLVAYGLPEYRIPSDVNDKQIRAYEQMGITFKCNVRVGADITVDQLSQSHDVVFIGSGAWKERMMRIPGEEHCVSGIDFLKQLHEGTAAIPTGDVLIIGGGNVGVDVATSLKRMGAAPLVVDRLAREQVAVIEHELHTAIEEGVEFDYLTMPVEIIKKGDRYFVRCQNMVKADPDPSGRPNVIPIEGEQIVLEVTSVYKSIGEVADTSILSQEQVESYQKKQWMHQAHLANNIYAGGDFLTGPSTVVQALGAGRRAAESINSAFEETPITVQLSVDPIRLFDPVGLEGTSAKILERERTNEEKIAAPMGEDFTGLSTEQAKTEASRCMTCGCISSSPSDLAPVLVALNAEVVTTQRIMKALDFFAPPGKDGKLNALRMDELVTEVVVPKPGAIRQCYVKFRTRGTTDFPVVSAAVVLREEEGIIKEANIVLGAVAPIPYKASDAEAVLLGKFLTEELAQQAGAMAVAKANPSVRNAFKKQVAKTLVRDALMKAK
jgi:NADPH-dependent glutamate synthase beta subunit-like oxidoreductase